MNSADATHKFDMVKYLSLLKPGSDFNMVGIPDEPLPQLSAGMFTGNAPKLTDSHVGNNQEMKDLLKLASVKGVRPWIETMPVCEAGCEAAIQKLKDGDVRARQEEEGARAY